MQKADDLKLVGLCKRADWAGPDDVVFLFLIFLRQVEGGVVGREENNVSRHFFGRNVREGRERGLAIEAERQQKQQQTKEGDD